MEIWTLIVKSNTFNFIFLVLILCWICKVCKIKQLLENAQNKVKETINNSENAKENSILELSEADKKVQNVANEIKEIDNIGKKNIEFLKTKILNETDVQIDAIKENVKKVVDAEEKDVISNLSKKTAIASIEIAKKHIIQVLKNKPEYHQKFIDESIEEFEQGLK